MGWRVLAAHERVGRQGGRKELGRARKNSADFDLKQISKLNMILFDQKLALSRSKIFK
jgi:hypothetical protein